MTFTSFCVGAIITFGILFATGFFGLIGASMHEEPDDSYFLSWMTSTIGFGVCLTILLYQNGILN